MRGAVAVGQPVRVGRVVESTPDKVRQPQFVRTHTRRNNSIDARVGAGLDAQIAALTNLVYIAQGDELAQCAFVQIGGL
jgi:hypothetical protein